MYKRLVDQVRLDHQVIINEFTTIGIIRMYTSHLRSGQENIVGLFDLEEPRHLCLIAQVELTRVPENEIIEAKLFEPSIDCRANHTLMTGDIDPCVLFH
jgi:hypothetical protein